MTVRVLLDGSMRIETHDGYVQVWHDRAANDVAELDSILQSIDDALAAAHATRIVFDSRESEYRGGEVQSRMWDWLQGHPRLKRVATLVKSELLATSVNMTGVSKAVRIKAFADEAQAVDWLMKV